MIPVERVVKKVKEEYPEFSEAEIREFVEEKRDEVLEETGNIDSEEIADDLAAAAHGQDDFELYSETGMYGLQVLSQRDEHVCNSCLDHDGSVYTLEEAKEKKPIPHDDCENKICRCSYLPIPDKDTYEKNKNEEPDLSGLYD